MVTICRYIEFNNASDIDGIVALFSPDAIVRDEARTHRGAAAIRAWLTATNLQYATRLSLVHAVEAAVVTARLEVSGTFPGSPITLSHRFTMNNNRIDALDIG